MAAMPNFEREMAAKALGKAFGKYIGDALTQLATYTARTENDACALLCDAMAKDSTDEKYKAIATLLAFQIRERCQSK